MHSKEQLETINKTIAGEKTSPAKSKIKYPKIKGGHRVYVRYPVQITQLDLGKTVVDLTLGKWMAVNVHLPTGYSRLIAPVQFDTEEECQKACDAHNMCYKFTQKQVMAIIDLSMQNVERSSKP